MDDTKTTLVDWLDDLCVRFVVNLPQEELESVERICFQIEEAQWFYEDFIRPLDSTLPSLNLRSFALRMFKHCPLLSHFSEEQHVRAFDEFLAYKTRVPVRGAILLNDAMDHIVLVKGWKKGSNWSFPRGKINKDENDLDCAVREAYEETGYDLVEAGLAKEESEMKFIEVTMREQHMKLFVFTGVPMNTPFAPRTRKEISKISWYKLTKLPGWKGGKHQKKTRQVQSDDEELISANKLYMVAPFLQPLKSHINQLRRNAARRSDNSSLNAPEASAAEFETDAYLTDERSMRPQLPLVSYDVVTSVPDWHYHNQQFGSPLADPRAQPSNFQGTDAASELKRMLSVGEQALANQQTQVPLGWNAHSGDLLAILNETPSMGQDRLGGYAQTQPHMQLQQMQSHPSSHPHYQHVGHPSMPRAEVRSQFGYPSGIMPGHSQQFNVRPPPVVQAEVDVFKCPPQAGFQQQLQQQHNWQAPQSTVQHNVPPRPYQRTGDPEFAHPQQSVTQAGQSIPRASELPAPKLGSHAMNLLNMFKIDALAATSAGSKPNNVDLTGPRNDNQAGLPFVEGAQPPSAAVIGDGLVQVLSSDVTSRQVLSQTASHPNFPHPPSVMHSSPSLVSRASKPDTQRTALLELFKKPSNSISPAPPSRNGSASIAGPSLVPSRSDVDSVLHQVTKEVPTPQTAHTKSFAQMVPVELSAASVDAGMSKKIPPPKLLPNPSIALETAHLAVTAPTTSHLKTSLKPWNMAHHPVELSATPNSASAKKQLFDPTDGKLKEHVQSPRILTRPHESSPPRAEREKVSSATVSGPIKTPDFGPSKHRSRHPKSDSKQTKAEVLAKATVPIQILKRPVTPKKTEPSLPAATPVSVHNGTKQTKPPIVTELHPQMGHIMDPSSSAKASKASRSRPVTPKAPVAKPFAPQILRRPQDPVDRELPTPVSPHGKISLQDSSTIESPPSPFQMQDSMFPQPVITSPSAAPEAVPAPPIQGSDSFVEKPINRTPLSGIDHKQSLLSLFGKSPAPPIGMTPSQLPSLVVQSPPLATSTATSPTDRKASLLSLFSKPTSFSARSGPSQATTRNDSQATSTAQHSPVELGTPSPIQPLPVELPLMLPSRINSISSTGPTPLAVQAPTSAMTFYPAPLASTAERTPERRGSGASSVKEQSRSASLASTGQPAPMSPSDRGFLLDYLAGFSRKGASRQGK